MKRFYALFTALTLLFFCATVQAQEDCGSPGSFIPAVGAPATIVGNTSAAADDYDEQCESFSNVGGVDQVFTWSPSVTGAYDVTLCTGNTNFDTKLYIYEGSCPAAGSGATGTEIACGEDECDNAPFFTNPWVSEVTNICMNAGTTYYFVIDGWSGADFGDFTCAITPSAPVAGSDLALTDARNTNYTWRPNYDDLGGVPFAAAIVNQGGSDFTGVTVTTEVFSINAGAVVFSDVSPAIDVPFCDPVQVVGGTAGYDWADDDVFVITYNLDYAGGADDTATNDTIVRFFATTDTFAERSETFFGAPIFAASLVGAGASTQYGVLLSYTTDVEPTTADLFISTGAADVGGVITATLYEIGVGGLDDNTVVASGTAPVDTSTIFYSIPLTGGPIGAGDYILTYTGPAAFVYSEQLYTPVGGELVRDPVVTGGTWSIFVGPLTYAFILQTNQAAAGCDASSGPASITALDDTPPGFVTINWDPVPLSVGCQLRATSPFSASQNILGPEVSGFTIPYSLVPGGPGTTVTVEVICACSIDPLVLTPASPSTTFTVPVLREGAVEGMTMFPNPADEIMYVSYNAVEGNANMSIIDVMGRTVEVRAENLGAGTNNLSFDVSGLAPGAYFLVIEQGEQTTVEEFSVVRF
jgi:hypothetical protein